MELEKKKENSTKIKHTSDKQEPSAKTNNDDIEVGESDDSENEIGDIDEYLDWRSKKAYK